MLWQIWSEETVLLSLFLALETMKQDITLESSKNSGGEEFLAIPQDTRSLRLQQE